MNVCKVIWVRKPTDLEAIEIIRACVVAWPVSSVMTREALFCLREAVTFFEFCNTGMYISMARLWG